jgi:hypothetical protein
MSTVRQRLPNRRASRILSFEDGGHRYIVSFSCFPGTTKPAEIFLDSGKPNSLLKTYASDSAVLVSSLNVETIRRSISGPIRIALDLLAADSAAAEGGAP